MEREATTNGRGTSVPNMSNDGTGNKDDPFMIGQSISQKSDDWTWLPPWQQQPCATAGKRPRHKNNEEGHGSDDVEEIGPNRPHLSSNPSVPMRRSHKGVGVGRLAPTPTETTFPAFEDDTEKLDLQPPGSSLDTLLWTAQSFRETHSSPQERKRGSTNASGNPSAHHSDDFSPSRTPTRIASPQVQSVATQAFAPPTRQQVLAFMRAEIHAFNHKKEHGSLPLLKPTRTSSRQRTSIIEDATKDTPFVPFTAHALFRKFQNSELYNDVPGSVPDGPLLDGSDERGQPKDSEVAWLARTASLAFLEQKEKENTASPTRTPTRKPTHLRKSTRRESFTKNTSRVASRKRGPNSPSVIHPSLEELIAATVLDSPRNPTAIETHEDRFNITVLLQTHLTAFPAIYADHPGLRLRPWEIDKFRSWLAPIDWNGQLRLKLDLHIACMDWNHFKQWSGVVRDDIVQLVKEVIESLLDEQRAHGPAGHEGAAVNVVVQTLRVENVINAVQARFGEQKKAVEARREVFPTLAKPAFLPAVEQMRALRQFERGEQHPLHTFPNDNAGMNNEASCKADDWQERKESIEMSEERCRLRLAELDQLEAATCLLTWLWLLEAVPEDFLSSCDLASIGQVFRKRGEKVGRPSGAVSLIEKQVGWTGFGRLGDWRRSTPGTIF